MNTAQWKGVEEHCPDPHCFQLWGQLGQAERREFPHAGTVVTGDGMPSGMAEPWPCGSKGENGG